MNRITLTKTLELGKTDASIEKSLKHRQQDLIKTITINRKTSYFLKFVTEIANKLLLYSVAATIT